MGATAVLEMAAAMPPARKSLAKEIACSLIARRDCGVAASKWPTSARRKAFKLWVLARIACKKLIGWTVRRRRKTSFTGRRESLHSYRFVLLLPFRAFGFCHVPFNPLRGLPTKRIYNENTVYPYFTASRTLSKFYSAPYSFKNLKHEITWP